MEEREKINVKLRLAATLKKVIVNNAEKIKTSKESHPLLIGSIRQLEAASGLSYTILQSISVGRRDPQFTTLVSLIEEGFGLTLSDFFSIYESIEESDLVALRRETKSLQKKDLKKFGKK